MHQLEEIGHYSHQNHHHQDIKKINYPDSIMDTQKNRDTGSLEHTLIHICMKWTIILNNQGDKENDVLLFVWHFFTISYNLFSYTLVLPRYSYSINHSHLENINGINLSEYSKILKKFCPLHIDNDYDKHRLEFWGNQLVWNQ